jgi:hypothetical protein
MRRGLTVATLATIAIVGVGATVLYYTGEGGTISESARTACLAALAEAPSAAIEDRAAVADLLHGCVADGHLAEAQVSEIGL